MNRKIVRNSPITYQRDIKNIKEQLYMEDRMRGSTIHFIGVSKKRL